jgi:hypothetical protein
VSGLILRLPDSLLAERLYAAHVVLTLHLGLSFEPVFENRRDLVVHRAGDLSRTLRMPDLVFSCGEKDWPTSAVRPPRVNQAPSATETAQAPAEFPSPVGTKTRHDLFDADVMGTAFWYLARVEESLCSARDSHARFPLAASNDENQHPTVDMLTDALGRALLSNWPDLVLRQHVYQLVPSHDVDRPFKHLFQSSRALARQMAGDTLRRESLRSIFASPWRRRQIRRGRLGQDPFNTFDWLMDQSERLGVRSTFYFISKETQGGVDGDYRIDDPRIRAVLQRIHARGHLIGLHGSYLSAFDSDLLRSEAQRLRRVCEEENIDLGPMRLRQHVLRFEPRRSIGVWAEAGIAEDSTLGHAERAGFRCGTSREFPLFDLSGRRMTSVLERPLIAMDVSLTEPRYEGLSHEQAAARIEDLARTCSRYGGSFALLWHNCRLADASARSTYVRGMAQAASFMVGRS